MVVSRKTIDLAEGARILERLRMEGLGRLAWGIGHDFNNALATILCYSRLIEVQLPEDAAVMADVAEIRAAAKRGQDLARLLAAFARRPQNGQPAPVDLTQQIESLLRLLRHNFGDLVVLRFSPPVRPIPIGLDIVTFSETLLEILVAAQRSLQSGGEIAISVSGRAASTTEAAGNGGPDPLWGSASNPSVLLTFTLIEPGYGDASCAPFDHENGRAPWPGPILRPLIESIPARTGCRVTIGSTSEPARSIGLYLPIAPGGQAAPPVDLGDTASSASKAS